MIKYPGFLNERSGQSGAILPGFFIKTQQPVAKVPNYVVMDLHA